jgi:hypothetical protein
VILLWAASILLLAVAVGAFYFLGSYPLWLRLTVALALWPLPPLVVTAWVIAVGDKAPPDAITITQPGAKR